MGNKPGDSRIYEVIHEWKLNSLLNDYGLIWKEERIWSSENLHRLRNVFIDQPDESSDNFYKKLERQLAGEDEAVYKYMIELLFIYYLVPTRTTYETKISTLEMVANWKGIEMDFNQDVFQALKKGLAATGASYNTRMYFEITMIHLFAENMKRYTVEEREALLKNRKQFKLLMTKTRQEVQTKVQIQHILQHVLMPEHFEWIASWSDKEKVVQAFSHYLENSTLDDIDERIAYIKQQLKEVYGHDIDFYHTPEIRELWKPTNKKKRYFWLAVNSTKESLNGIEDKGTIEFILSNESRQKGSYAGTSLKAKAGDDIILYESNQKKEIIGVGRIEKSYHVNERNEDIIRVSYEKSLPFITWTDITTHPILKESEIVKSNHDGRLFELTKQEYDTIIKWRPEKIGETHEEFSVNKSEVAFPTVSFEKELLPEKLALVFENEDILLDQIMTALRNGDHIILTGPPGTGKSKLAKQICEMYDVQAKMVTASSNWSTYDTIGGYRPDRSGHLSFDSGIFLDAVKVQGSNLPKNEWVIIDEINRADIDKAFGSLFSVLTGDTVSLPFEAENGEKIELAMQGEIEVIEPSEHRYVIPKDWRLIGTMNTVDKASLFEMSYAFMRRFAFIPVGIPKTINETLMKRYIEVWEIDNYMYTKELVDVWKLINQYRKIGPAIIRDIARYTAQNNDFISAIILYVLPQFEGLSDYKVRQFIDGLAKWPEIIPDRSLLDDFVEDFFQQGEF